MQIPVSGRTGRVFSRALVALVFSGVSALASAQTTVTLNDPATEVVAATIRGGSYANKTDQSLLSTRSADNLEYNRRALLKFDTQKTIPAGSVVTSALLTVTVKDGSEDASRSIGAFQVTTSWVESEVTWNRRRIGSNWGTRGGDLGSKLDDATVSNKPGTKVTFDVTPLVKEAVAGRLGSSRYTRIALVDLDQSTHESYREYATPDDPNAAARPVLKVTYGKDAKPPKDPKPDPPPGSAATLRVLNWNTHHNGVGSDGVLDTARLIKWVAKLNPDIISLQEVERFSGWGNMDAPAVMASLLKQYSGKTWYYHFATLTGAAKGIGDLILSRFPLESDASQLLVGGRSATNVTVTVNGRTINFTSVHLHSESSSYRMQEIAELTAWLKAFPEQRIVAGDFNASYTHPENAAMKQTYNDSWGVAQANGTAVAYPGNPAGNTRNGRIDYIYYSKTAAFLTMKGSQVFDARDANGHMPSDHRPLLTTFTVK